ncbi:MAG: dTMP kinase, partial [Candidatus Omnitrophota bacterium]
FITFEGPEGCGKSTHAGLLFDFLKGLGYPCIRTREPGGTKAGELIRQVLLHARDCDLSDLTELFLFEAARAQIVSEVIIPALSKGTIVICDRFSDATLAYQGYGGKLPLPLVRQMNRAATGGLTPDLTILLDVDVATGLRRAKAKGVDRMEEKKAAYHSSVRRGYLALAKAEPERIKKMRLKPVVAHTQKNIQKLVTGFLADRTYVI